MNRPSQRSVIERLLSRPRSLANRRRLTNRRPEIEGLEVPDLAVHDHLGQHRLPDRGRLGHGDYWQGGVVPGTSDTAVIDLTSGTVTTGPSDSVLSLMTNASTTVSVANGSLTLGAATSSIAGAINVSSTGTLAQRHGLDRHWERDRRRPSHHQQQQHGLERHHHGQRQCAEHQQLHRAVRWDPERECQCQRDDRAGDRAITG